MIHLCTFCQMPLSLPHFCIRGAHLGTDSTSPAAQAPQATAAPTPTGTASAGQPAPRAISFDTFGEPIGGYAWGKR